MSAPSIPNLSSLRRGGLRGSGRGGGTLRDVSRPHEQSSTARRDEIIQQTDQDAATSRLSAVEAGYLEDPFARYLTSNVGVSRRLPLMNRGSYVRTTGIDRIVSTFLNSGPSCKKQIVSLGAGSDTRYFRIGQKQSQSDVVYHELDFATNTKGKIVRIRSPVFSNLVRKICNIDVTSPDFQILSDGSELLSSSYNIHPLDLRLLTNSKTSIPSLDVTLPTLLISECCLIYLSPEDADGVLDYFTKIFKPDVPLAIVIYETIRPNDAFGRTMISNLTTRGIQLQTLQKYAGLQEQRLRLRRFGFGSVRAEPDGSSGAEAADIDFIWRKWSEEAEKERVEDLEWMDEVEEFVLLAKHYCIAWGWRGFKEDGRWEDLLGQRDGA